MSEDLTGELVRSISQLVQFRSTADRPEETRAAVLWVRRFMEAAPVEIVSHEVDGLPAMVITPRANPRPRVLLQGHLDVVDGSDEQFAPRVANSKLWGRGTADMKGFVAVALHLVRDLVSAGGGHDVGVMLTCDEETTGHGAEHLAQLGWRAEVIINGDGGTSDAVTHAEKGILDIQASCEVQPARRAHPWESGNALEQIIAAHRRLMAMFPEHAGATGEDNWHSTCAALDLTSERVGTYVPHRASLRARIFFTEDVTVEELLGQVRSRLRDCTVEQVAGAERVHLDAGDPHITCLRELLQRHLGRPIAVRADNGTSDARFFTRSGSAIVITRVPGGEFHSPDEHIDIPSLAPFTQALREYTLMVLAGDMAAATGGERAR